MTEQTFTALLVLHLLGFWISALLQMASRRVYEEGMKSASPERRAKARRLHLAAIALLGITTGSFIANWYYLTHFPH